MDRAVGFARQRSTRELAKMERVHFAETESRGIRPVVHARIRRGREAGLARGLSTWTLYAMLVPATRLRKGAYYSAKTAAYRPIMS
jgi:hypothetical protein